VRLTRSGNGVVVDGASDGRGAWLCRGEGAGVEPGCLAAALAKRAFARAWRCELTSDDERAISDLVRPRANGDESPDAH
jgi:predicted RNA-binding protein YlxR (DUF448 family)